MAFYDRAMASVDKGNETGIFYLDLCKTFDTVHHHILISKLQGYGFEWWIVHWINHCLNGHSQRVVDNGSVSWRSPFMNGVPQGFILGPVLFSNFNNGIDID